MFLWAKEGLAYPLKSILGWFRAVDTDDDVDHLAESYRDAPKLSLIED